MESKDSWEMRNGVGIKKKRESRVDLRNEMKSIKLTWNTKEKWGQLCKTDKT